MLNFDKNISAMYWLELESNLIYVKTVSDSKIVLTARLIDEQFFKTLLTILSIAKNNNILKTFNNFLEIDILNE